MKEYILSFSGEDWEELNTELQRKERKAKWLAMSEEEKQVEYERIKKLIDEILIENWTED